MHYGHGGKRSGEPWNKSDSDWFQLKKKKEINMFLIGPFKVAKESG